jgi:hypothetical protein
MCQLRWGGAGPTCKMVGPADGTRVGLDPPVRWWGGTGGTHVSWESEVWDPHGRLGGAGPTCKVVGWMDGTHVSWASGVWDPRVMGKWGVGPTCHGVGWVVWDPRVMGWWAG